MPRILIIEDDEKLREELKIFLNKNGYEATTLTTFDNTINDILKINPDLILLDINLPNTDGEYICKEIRKQSNMPIIIVTSRDNEIDELLSINNGADHYITKPFNIQILLAKIGSLLRRSNMQGETNDKIDVKDFILNTSNNTIEKDGKVIELTKNEYKILKYSIIIEIIYNPIIISGIYIFMNIPTLYAIKNISIVIIPNSNNKIVIAFSLKNNLKSI